MTKPMSGSSGTGSTGVLARIPDVQQAVEVEDMILQVNDIHRMTMLEKVARSRAVRVVCVVGLAVMGVTVVVALGGSPAVAPGASTKMRMSPRGQAWYCANLGPAPRGVPRPSTPYVWRECPSCLDIEFVPRRGRAYARSTPRDLPHHAGREAAWGRSRSLETGMEISRPRITTLRIGHVLDTRGENKDGP